MTQPSIVSYSDHVGLIQEVGGFPWPASHSLNRGPGDPNEYITDLKCPVGSVPSVSGCLRTSNCAGEESVFTVPMIPYTTGSLSVVGLNAARRAAASRFPVEVRAWESLLQQPS
jgi:hypothetical protein